MNIGLQLIAGGVLIYLGLFEWVRSKYGKNGNPDWLDLLPFNLPVEDFWMMQVIAKSALAFVVLGAMCCALGVGS